MSFVRTKLSIMMFLEFAIWGVWAPLLPGYLGDAHCLNFEEWWQKALIMNAFSVAAIAAMFFSNQFADRNFAAEKFVAFSHLIGGLAILSLMWVTEFWTFFALMLIHCLFYVPTISITNSIAFTHLKDAQREFSLVRLWGTIGWIAVGIPFIFILLDWTKVPAFSFDHLVDWLGHILGDAKEGAADKQGKSYIFLVAGLCSLALAGFSLVLPHTPAKPAKEATERTAWIEAAKLLRHPFILVLFLVTFVDSAVHAGYFYFAGTYLKSIGIQGNWIMPVMSIGQFAEIGTMAYLGYCLKHLGWRKIMALGILGHTVRFGVFALVPIPGVATSANIWIAITVNILHGICYAFFFATVYIFVDEFFPKDARSSAQGLFNFLILGLGPLVGYFLWPFLQGVYTTNKIVDYHTLFLIPAGAALSAAVFLLLFFWPPAKVAQPEQSVVR